MKIKFTKEVEDQIEIIKVMKHLIGQTTSLVENLRIDHVRDRIFDLQQDRGIWSVLFKNICKNIWIEHDSSLGLYGKANLKLMSIQEREKFHTKLVINTFNKILRWNVLKLGKEMAIYIQKVYRILKQDQIRNSSCHIIVKTIYKSKKAYSNLQ